MHGDKELREKLGRNDLCPCGSARRFQEVLHEVRRPRRLQPPRLLSGSDRAGPPATISRVWRRSAHAAG
ncbi:SEC-C metal-binding domain-containing protein [Longimicrobium sp.]|uniref:SEC-C metal-binding domain-containing protein n=1 Tax=Longimicrobium sp. TaxID=2029185 RepID=UPI0032C23852